MFQYQIVSKLLKNSSIHFVAAVLWRLTVTISGKGNSLSLSILHINVTPPVKNKKLEWVIRVRLTIQWSIGVNRAVFDFNLLHFCGLFDGHCGSMNA